MERIIPYGEHKTKFKTKTLILEKDISKKALEELMQMEPAIKMAEDKLDFLSSDPETIELYKAREY